MVSSVQMLDNSTRFNRFNEFVNRSSLIDLGYQSPQFTRHNWREGGGIAILNDCLVELYKDAMVESLSIVGSDSGPIVLYMNSKRKQNKKFPFSLEAKWFLQDSFYNLTRSNLNTFIKGSKALQFVRRLDHTTKEFIH